MNKNENGIFLTINHDYWSKDEKDKEIKKKKKYMVMTPMEENYDIAGFLKEFHGFYLVFNSLIIEKKTINYEITGKKLMKNISLCDNFENLINFQNLLGFFKRK